jgi:hypothetical protein
VARPDRERPHRYGAARGDRIRRTLRLLRRSFALPTWPSLVGATIFATHGAFVFRMMAGQLAYHSVVLVPFVASFLVRRPAGTALFDGAAAGALLAYMALSGNLTFLVPVGLALAALGALDSLESGAFAWIGRLAAAVLFAVVLALFKLVAVGAFMSSFPRDFYAVPAMRTLGESAWLAATSLLGHGFELAASRIDNPNWWRVGEVDYEMGITPVGVALGMWGAALAARHPVRERRWLPLAVLASLLVVPLLVNWRATEGVLKAIPVIGSTSSFVRWLWIYVPVAIVLGARALASVAVHPRLGPVLVPLVLLSLILEDKSGYRERVYHEAPITEGWRALRERGSPPPIANVATSVVAGVRRDDALIAGASAFPCYEPTFGYGSRPTRRRGSRKDRPPRRSRARSTSSIRVAWSGPRSVPVDRGIASRSPTARRSTTSSRTGRCRSSSRRGSASPICERVGLARRRPRAHRATPIRSGPSSGERSGPSVMTSPTPSGVPSPHQAIRVPERTRPIDRVPSSTMASKSPAGVAVISIAAFRNASKPGREKYACADSRSAYRPSRNAWRRKLSRTGRSRRSVGARSRNAAATSDRDAASFDRARQATVFQSRS